jgi:hypothetical protein
MYLLLGDLQDPCCLSVRNELEARNHPTLVISNPLAHPARFAWWLDNDRSASQLIWDEGSLIPDDQIAGVLVRSAGWLDPTGWQPKDLAYMQAETQAALIAWLWSLACPVVNRYPPSIWYRQQVPLLFWHPFLRRCGLPTLETLVTNVEQEARSFGRDGAREGVDGVVYGPLSSSMKYLVANDQDWQGLATMQRIAPVSLDYPHGAAQFVCVAGEHVVWEGETSSQQADLEPALRQFSRAAGLDFVELALAPVAGEICVIAVEPHPYFEHFGGSAQQQIVNGIVEMLITERYDNRKQAARTS